MPLLPPPLPLLTAASSLPGVSLSSIPRDLLLAELAKRDTGDAKPECGSGKKGSYDTPLHVFALVLILALSTLGTSGLGTQKKTSKIIG